MGTVTDIQALLHFFQDKVPDKESNRSAQKFANDPASWNRANILFDAIQERSSLAMKEGSSDKEQQYYFEKSCAKTLFNLTGPDEPYDPDTPYWVLKYALILAKTLNENTDEIINIITTN